MKAPEIRDLSIEDIQSKIQEAKSDYEKMKLNHRSGGIENPLNLRTVRRNIARMNTILVEKQKQS